MMGKEPDSSFSHSACQIELEKKAESLKMKTSCLADVGLSQNEKETRDINRITNLFLMEPHRINGGMISGHLQTHTNIEVQPFTLLRQNNDLTNVVIQGNQGKIHHPSSHNKVQQQQQQQRNPHSKPWQGRKTRKKMDEDR